MIKSFNFKPRVLGDTVKGVVVPFNIPVADLNITFQIRHFITDALLYEATTESGIVAYETNKALIERFETDDFKIGEHDWEIKVEHKTDGWDKVVYRGKFPIVNPHCANETI